MIAWPKSSLELNQIFVDCSQSLSRSSIHPYVDLRAAILVFRKCTKSNSGLGDELGGGERNRNCSPIAGSRFQANEMQNSGRRLPVCSNQFHLPKNGRESMKLESLNPERPKKSCSIPETFRKWYTTGDSPPSTPDPARQCI